MDIGTEDEKEFEVLDPAFVPTQPAEPERVSEPEPEREPEPAQGTARM